MESKKNPEEFYDKLKFQLEETTTWPSVYLYKFIVFTNQDRANSCNF
jgi:hypothetical protein